MNGLGGAHVKNDSGKVVHKLRDEVPVAGGGCLRSPTPTHVVPDHPKPLSEQGDNPVPNGGAVRIPVNEDDSSGVRRPVLIDREA
jgi:hypothetical protein